MVCAGKSMFFKDQSKMVSLPLPFESKERKVEMKKEEQWRRREKITTENYRR